MELEQLEALALGKDRQKALAALIPGTDDYYRYHCLHWQQQGDLDRAREVLQAWIKRHGRTGPVREMERRQVLLDYERDPKTALDHVRQALHLRFDHRRQVEDRQHQHPTALASRLLDRASLCERALGQAGDLSGFTDRGLDLLLGRKLDSKQRRKLLERLAWPDVPGLVNLVSADLADRDTGGFGSLSLHRMLLPGQLDALGKRHPELWDDDGYVRLRLSQMRPSPDADWRADAALYREYLEHLWVLAQPLGPVFNSLKSLILYYLLDLDRRESRRDRARFLAYLALPRQAGYAVSERWQRVDRRHVARLDADYRDETGLDPVGPAGGDEPLVRDYLLHFLAGADSAADFAGLVRDDLLRFALAGANIMAGLGNKERWYALLDDPDTYREITEWVDIEFAPENPRHIAADQPVSLDVYVKNVPALVVKVFEIDVRSYFLVHGRDVDTSVDLDGLVATHEAVHRYDDAPELRVRRTFAFPELVRPGVYVVELVGAGKSSRALIRKGGLRFVERLGAAGQVLAVVDADNQPVPDATLWLGGHEYVPRDGRIVVPYTPAPRTASVLLCHGDLASVTELEHRDETYHLGAAIHVEREALISGATAAVVIRPRLAIHDARVAIDLLQEPVLAIEAVDHDGVHTRTETPVVLHDDHETVHELKVLPDLSRLTVTLRGKVRSLSRGEDIDLETRAEFSVNQIDKTDQTGDVFLRRTAAGYVLCVLGKTGEPLAGRPVSLSLHHRDVTRSVDVTLQSDARGRVELGALDDIAYIRAAMAGGRDKTWTLADDACTHPRAVHGLAGETITLPYMHGPGTDERRRVSLLAVRGTGPSTVYTADASSHVTVAGGYVELRDLAPGDYELAFLPELHRVRVRVTAGPRFHGWGLGQRRLLELSSRRPLQITTVELDSASDPAPGTPGDAGDHADSAVVIRLAGITPATRVHVAGACFVGHQSLWTGLANDRPALPAHVDDERTPVHYISGRDIGDEYRYVLERRHAVKFAGNMLERPSLLLNPWAIRSTDTGVEHAKGGEAYGKSAKAKRMAGPRPAPKPQAPRSWPGGFASFDFLARPSALLCNLRPEPGPDGAGVVRIARSVLGQTQCVRVLATDDRGSVYREIPLPEAEVERRDLRLQASLPAAVHLGERKAITPLRAGARLVIDDIRTASVEVYDSLTRVYRLFGALSGDSTLSRFAFILDWPELDEPTRRERYSEYACHELHFFLQRKDPAFFTAVIRPYLAAKLHKTFFDHYLLENDLTPYLHPWAYNRLNIVERILLSRAIAREAGPTRRHVRDLFELIPPDVERDSRLFAAALQGGALDVHDALGISGARGALADMPESAAAPAMLAASIMGGGGAPPPPPMAPPAPGAPVPRTLARVAAAKAMDMDMDMEDETAELPIEEFAADFDDGSFDRRARDEVRAVYRPADRTREWAENNYYHVRRADQHADLVRVNAFWRDFAEHDGSGPFLSPNVAHAAGNFTEMMLALAVLDLPFRAAKHQVAYTGARMELAAGAPGLVVHKQIGPSRDRTENAAQDPLPVLVRQSYVRADDRYEHVGNEIRDKFVTGDMLVHVVYGCRVVVTNPTSVPHNLDVLLQIPRGAVPVSQGFLTRSKTVTVQAYGTASIEYFFYFPEPGEFDHYPAQVSKDEVFIAAPEPATLTVVERLREVDTGSWAHVSQHGDLDQVLAYLASHNIERLDLTLIAWRMRDPDAYRNMLAVLAERHAYDRALWSYSVFHDDPERMAEYLAREELFAGMLGPWFASRLVRVDAVERVWYEHLEYAPLVNARAHPLGKGAKILNSALESQYRGFLRQLVYRPAPDADDRLAATYYFLLQDRIAEALEQFDQVDPGAVTASLQYQYMRVFVAMYRGDLDAARQVAEAHVDHPVDRWRKRFQAALAVIAEAGGGVPEVVDRDSRDQAQARLAATQPGFDVVVDNRTITISYQNLSECRVNYYPMDIELLFSRRPFVAGEGAELSIIKPQQSQLVVLPAGGREHAIALPSEYHSANVIVEVVAAGRRVAQAYYANDLLVQVVSQYGQVRVYQRSAGVPLSGVYIKVYARKRGGDVAFYKDGYTDVRGGFDYVSLSTDELDQVERFALLIASVEHGALIREAAPPRS